MAHGPFFPADWQQGDGVKASDDGWKNQYLLNLKSKLIDPLGRMIADINQEQRTGNGAGSVSNRDLLKGISAGLVEAKSLAERLNSNVISGKTAEVKLVVTGETINSFVYQPLVKIASTLSQYARSADVPEFQQALELINQAKRLISTAIINMDE